MRGAERCLRGAPTVVPSTHCQERPHALDCGPQSDGLHVLDGESMIKLIEAVRPRRPSTHRPAEGGTQSARIPTLPPGGRDELDDVEKVDRTAILRRSREFGPMFTGTTEGEVCVYLVGLALGRRFLHEHSESLRPRTLELEGLFPKGFLRQMGGEDHRDYRRALVRASRSLDTVVDQAVVDAVFESALHDLSTNNDSLGPLSPLLGASSAIATAVLVVLFFGAEPGSERFNRMVAEFRRLGPFGLVWNLRDPQHEAFAALRDQLRNDLADRRAGTATMADACVLSQVANDGEVDETMLGNLIYMVEMGRQDMQVLFRWILRYAASNPEALARIAAEESENDASVHPTLSAAEAFVVEVLRSDQSERLMRRATRDIVFDGYLIPKNAYVRICMWEAHHDPEVFVDPFRFDPERFLRTKPTKEQFSPFGIDHHQCPFATMSIGLGTALLRSVAAAYDVSVMDDGAVVRGAYHWEPSRRLRLRLTDRPERP